METCKAQLIQNVNAPILSSLSSRANYILFDLQFATAFNLNT